MLRSKVMGYPANSPCCKSAYPCSSSPAILCLYSCLDFHSPYLSRFHVPSSTPISTPLTVHQRWPGAAGANQPGAAAYERAGAMLGRRIPNFDYGVIYRHSPHPQHMRAGALLGRRIHNSKEELRLRSIISSTHPTPPSPLLLHPQTPTPLFPHARQT